MKFSGNEIHYLVHVKISELVYQLYSKIIIDNIDYYFISVIDILVNCSDKICL